MDKKINVVSDIRLAETLPAKFYKEKGLFEAIAYVILIVIGFKVVVINGIIYSINYLFLTDIKYGPVLYYIFGVQLI